MVEALATTTYHERCEVILVLLGLDAKVFKVEVAVRMRLDRDNLETGHDRGLHLALRILSCSTRSCTHSRVGSMGADGDQADVPMSLAARLVVGPDDGEPSVLARSARVGLHRACMETGDLAEVRLQLLK